MDLEISPDGERLASYGENGMLRIWDARTGIEQLLIEAPFGWERLGVDGAGGLAFSPDGAAIASGFWNGAKLWDATTGEVLLEIEVEGRAVQSQGLEAGRVKLMIIYSLYLRSMKPLGHA